MISTKVTFSFQDDINWLYLLLHQKLKPRHNQKTKEIRASRLVKLWAAEGFLKRVSDKSPEEAAEIYLKALVDRNLIFIHRQEPKGNVRSYSLHDLLRDLCVRKAHEEKFLLVKEPDGPPRDTLQLRRMSTQDTNISAKQMQHARSFLFTGAASPEILSDVVSEFIAEGIGYIGNKIRPVSRGNTTASKPKTSSCLVSFFPSTLKKLTVSSCIILEGHMKKIGELSNLEVLKLQKDHFDSSTWEPTEGEFSRLRFLLLEDLNLVNWIADDSHFPRLEHLVIRGCSNLEEIPAGIGEITTLEIIEVQHSSASAVASAVKIQEEQADYGVQVRFGPSS
ncbi:UNVERIFIED_CONTAM: putative late blight resistance proteinR1A-4 [Sesamum radiatum]|uniref:Late blight resistance proteinR1A-4 n=1 Tax=Sesamum radiatum TaxID=300843 RepID=A0AAW2MYH8_SESRA